MPTSLRHSLRLVPHPGVRVAAECPGNDADEGDGTADGEGEGKPEASASRPMSIGPKIWPKSPAIWKVESTLPPERSLPTMSPTAACWEGLINPEEAPAKAETSKRNHTLVAMPISTMKMAEPIRPMRMSGLRPWISDHLPENCKTMALPAAKTASARPEAAAPLWKMEAAKAAGRIRARPC